jgi:hypothetical protein
VNERRKKMEDILHEPMELTNAQLFEVTGGGGCGCDELVSIDAPLVNVTDNNIVVVVALN